MTGTLLHAAVTCRPFDRWVRPCQVVPGIFLQKGESPVWSGADSLLYFVDIDGKAIHSYDPGTGVHDKLDMPAMVGAVRALRNEYVS